MRKLRWQLTLFCISFVAVDFASAGPFQELAELPVQDAGRIKPYDTFARESLELIYGKATFKSRPALEVVTTWWVLPQPWEKTEFFEIRHSGLRDALNLDHKRLYYSPAEILSNVRLPVIMQELKTLREQGEKLNPYFQSVQRLENQLGMFQSIRLGQALRFVPSAQGDTWLSLDQLQDPIRSHVNQLATEFARCLAGTVSEEGPSAACRLSQAVQAFQSAAKNLALEKYPEPTALRIEVSFNRTHPFQWAWGAYLLGAIALIVHLLGARKGGWQKVGYAFVGLGFIVHTVGIGIRVYLAGRPPVSNMYETVVWVPWGSLIFSFWLARWLKNQFVVVAATLIATFCLILTDLAPTVLDGSIHPLEPVLRSTFWLTTHVLIITISYAAFFLAFALGDWALWLYWRGEQKHHAQIQSLVTAIYRSIQIGVVLLAAGIILGGVWADYSWGRFWGWDPKETWALVALLGYIALLHGRLVGWFRHFGLAAGSVVAFALVIMAWYGVNFVLGAGLHSYGFGAGGVEYVSAFVAAHLIYVGYVSAARS